MIYRGGSVYTKGGFSKCDIEVRDGIITGLGSFEGEGEDCQGAYIIPMTADIHTHGCLGIDFTKAGPRDIDRMKRFYESQGVSFFLPTLISSPKSEYRDMLERLNMPVRLEGPFFGKAKKGAHEEKNLILPDYDMIMSLGDRVAMVDIDPTQKGGIELIYRLESQGIKTSAAHTAASYQCAMEAFDAGCRHVTHLFNAMNPIHHRESGLIGAAFDRKDVKVELICDGCHVSPPVIRMAFELFKGRVCVISDSHATMGISREDCARLPDGTIAGTVRGLDSALFNLPQWGIDLEKTVKAEAETPFEALNMAPPQIKEGSEADFIIMKNGKDRLFKVVNRGSMI